jgi:hypothetical protein
MWNNYIAGLEITVYRSHSVGGNYLLYTQFVQGIDVGFVVYPVRRD